jgi:hypothetical protein
MAKQKWAKIIKNLRKTKLISIVPPVATAEINLNVRNNSYQGENTVNNPATDCSNIAIIKGIFRPILKICYHV